MNPFWEIETGRLHLAPVAPADLPDLQALKADPRVFALMLGGVRTPVQAAQELAQDMSFWAAHGIGIWTVRDRATARFLGMTGLHERPDGRGPGLRFALAAGAAGHGFASEAAGAALRFAHDRAGIPRVVAVARESNLASRHVLGAIGMRRCDAFVRDGEPMLVYESLRPVLVTPVLVTPVAVTGGQTRP